jgi:serine/threonine-protein kinase
VAAVCLLRDIASGLRDAHEAHDALGRPLRIVHRDVSPHNVMVGRDGVARLADFGIAKATHRLARSEAGNFKGKVIYAAPEQLTGGTVDARTDLFAWGVIAWELLTGMRPTPAHANPVVMAQWLLEHGIPDPRTIRPALPAPLAELINAALERRPEARVQSAREIVAALTAHLAAQGTEGEPKVIADTVAALAGDDVALLEEQLSGALRDAVQRRGRGSSGIFSREVPVPCSSSTQIEIDPGLAATARR